MQESEYLSVALSLAEQRRGFCAPNPSVGAVVVKNDQIIAQGEHWGVGHPHAEVMAIKALGEKARDAELYITLEPCCHFGRTPPCTELIIQSGIKKVVYAYADPNPAVHQKSAKLLAQAGINCHQISLPEIDQFYESYAWWQQHQLPFVTAKLAISLDGKIALPHSKEAKITGKAAKLFTHQWRKRSDAILTTANTILADDPLLNVRLEGEAVISKPLYIIDRNSRLSKDERIFKSASRVEILQDKNLIDVLGVIGKAGVHDLWIEAGGRLFSALIKEKLVQRVFVYVAPMTLGQSSIEGFITESNVFADIKHVRWEICGSDVIAEMRWV